MKIRDLRKTYILKYESVEALKGVSFDLPEKGMVFILGKSGCGKSTLLNILSGLDDFDGGDIIYNGRSLKNFSKTELDSYRNSCCGFVFQEYNLIPELNVFDNIALAIEMQGKKDIEQKVKIALKNVGLESYEGRKVTELSGGQKQRIAIARSIVKNPQIIFADEPSGALDSETGASIFELLKEFSKEKLIIVVSHDRESAEKYGDRIIELSDGHIISETDKDNVEEESEHTYKVCRSKMPIKSALRIGCSNFKFHPIRMVATILLALFSFTFLGLTLVFGTFNKTTHFVNAVYDNNYEILPIQKYISIPEDYGFSFDDLFVSNKYKSELSKISDKDIETLQQYISEELMSVILVRSFIKKDYVKEWNDEFTKFVNESEEYIGSGYSGYMTLTEDIIKKYSFELIGRLPENNDEVVICEQHYNTYKYLGYKDESGKEYEINVPEEMIGRRIDYDSLIVAGILKTGCSRACYAENHRETQEIGPNGYPVDPTLANSPEYFTLENEYLFHEKLFVTKGYITSRIGESYYNKDNSYILCPVPKDKKELNALTKFIISYNNQGFDREGEFYKFSELNPTSEWYNAALLTSKPLSVIALYIGLIFFIFTIVLLFSFIATSVRSQMKQIGIISALGADFKQLYKIYAVSAVIVCSIVYLLSLLSVGIGVAWLNSMGWADLWFNMNGLPFKILSLNFVTIIIMFLVAMATALCGALIPLLKMRKLFPAEIIRRGQIK